METKILLCSIVERGAVTPNPAHTLLRKHKRSLTGVMVLLQGASKQPAGGQIRMGLSCTGHGGTQPRLMGAQL